MSSARKRTFPCEKAGTEKRTRRPRELGGERHHRDVEEATGGSEGAARGERVAQAEKRELADRVEDDVVGLARLGGTVLGIVEDHGRPQRLYELEVAGSREGRDLGAQVAGELDGRRADRARGAVHEDARAGADAGPAEVGQGGQGAIAGGGCLLE